MRFNKNILAALSLCVLAFSCSVHSPKNAQGPADALATTAAIPDPYDPQDLINVYRFSAPPSGLHFFSLSLKEGQEIHFHSEGVAFSVFQHAGPATVGIYRCYDGVQHFISVDPACEKRSSEGIYGYLFAAPHPGTMPLYRLFSKINSDHLITTEIAETVLPGYAIESILGYVPIVTLGHVDGVVQQDNSFQIQGWSCQFGFANSTKVQIYRGGPEGTGALIGTYDAASESEVAVSSACGDSNQRPHRFVIPIETALAQKFHGAPLVVQPVSMGGLIGNPLSTSNELRIPGGGDISTACELPRSKQGIADFRENDTDPITNARYAKFKEMSIAYRTYNYFWVGLEDSKVASSVYPVHCPPSYLRVPSDENEMKKLGYHRYRCLSEALIAQHDRLLIRDQENSLQSAIVFWAAPPMYRYPGCTGGAWGKSTMKDGCAPRDDAMDDFEDVLNFLANHYDGEHHFGKISHFVIWNEISNGLWLDYSPIISNRGVLSESDTEKLIAKYTEMMTRAHRAIQKNISGAMLYASIDSYWLAPKRTLDDFSDVGSKRIVDGLWKSIGVNFSWSLAVHPYGQVKVEPPPGEISFYNLETVTAYQQAMLKSLGIGADSFSFPQAFLLANEQGWPQSDGIEQQAVNICLAHQKSLSLPGLIGEAHNYFQSVEPQDQVQGATSNQGAFFGLLPSSSAIDLSDMASYATGQAYIATSPQVWEKQSDHFCCQIVGIGCAPQTTFYLSFRPASEVNIYRFYKPSTGEHFLTPSKLEGQNNQFHYERVGFKVLSDAVAGTEPLYRCLTGNKHFASTDPRCEGRTNEGSYGFIFMKQTEGTTPLYRFYASVDGDHIASTNFDEQTVPGYKLESILGYVPIGSLGSVDGIFETGSGYELKGWSCEYGVGTSTHVRLYRKDLTGQFTLLGTFKADKVSEPLLNQACGEGSATTPHRFAIALDPMIVAQNHGQFLVVEPISAAGLVGDVLSGTFRIP